MKILVFGHLNAAFWVTEEEIALAKKFQDVVEDDNNLYSKQDIEKAFEFFNRIKRERKQANLGLVLSSPMI